MHDSEDAGTATEPPTFDDLAAELRRLRLEANNPSYAELASRISRAREAAGEPATRARIARSTVYDVFRDGRRRLDVGLVREVLTALDLDTEAVAHWTAVARGAVPGPSPALPDAAGPEPHEDVEEIEEVAEVEEEVDEAAPEPDPPARTPRRLALILVACVVGNLAGRLLVDDLGLPLHLDMVWTAVSAILLGPWWGVLVGVATNVVGVPASGWDSLPFALVNATGALVWGYGVRHLGYGRTIKRFLALNVVAALACSVVATLILLLFFSELGPQTDRVSRQLAHLTDVTILAVFVPNLIFSLADKVFSGFVALAVLESRDSSAALGIGPVDRAPGHGDVPARVPRLPEGDALRTGRTD